MVFESLSDKLTGIFKGLRGKGKVNEGDIKAAMREVKLALLEADVNFKVVKEFIASVSEKAKGEAVLESLTPGQMIIKIVCDEMADLMGSTNSGIVFADKPPTVIMMLGLQGAGKTTTSAKLAALLRKQGKKPLLVACDVYRPAAIDQLKTVAKQLDMPVFSMDGSKDVPAIAKAAIEEARVNGNDIVILDTAGRLNIDEELMQELKEIAGKVQVDEKLLVVDSMIGQEAVNVAKDFDEQMDISGVILTKLDSDTRGGAALSLKSVVGKPIKFAGMGEKLSDLEVFHPERMAERILGMGDVMTLIEKAEGLVEEKQAKELYDRMMSQKFNLDDFLVQIEQLQKMGPISQIMDMLPGMNSKQMKGMAIDEKKFYRNKAIIQSMTAGERQNPSIINGSRRLRIAKGSGCKVQDINSLLSQFEQMKKMMKNMNNAKNKFSINGGKIPW